MVRTLDVRRAGYPAGGWFADLPVAVKIFAAVGVVALAAATGLQDLVQRFHH
ncbi:hypothetical protein [Actinoplanes siamensis]|uniref:Uncharacterized protein n=1 Tax=Actinoplanes siamensis TaxID=1223317 RepID=A0A919N638_9ACTN|nr:hypothetical protein [Actinoplanes siamensis]GIF05057.1 hypothetical protein Asi03nite_25950 [Actinoplanes siamensis]